jgi:hypothetical protein
MNVDPSPAISLCPRSGHAWYARNVGPWALRRGQIGGRTPIRSVDLCGPQQGQHLRRWTYCLASRRTVFKQLEQFAGVLAGKPSSNRFVGDQWNELRIDLAASNKRRRPDEPLYGDAQSGMAH